MKYLAANVGLIYENIYMRLERARKYQLGLPVEDGSCGLLWSNGHLAYVGSLCSSASGYLRSPNSFYLANILLSFVLVKPSLLSNAYPGRATYLHTFQHTNHHPTVDYATNCTSGYDVPGKRRACSSSFNGTNVSNLDRTCTGRTISILERPNPPGRRCGPTMVITQWPRSLMRKPATTSTITTMMMVKCKNGKRTTM